MRDRVPKYPGRVQLTPVAGQTNIYDMIRADEPTEPGDALNKANLLPDSVATAIGLTGDAVVKDALEKLSGAALRKTVGGVNSLADMLGNDFPLPFSQEKVTYFVTSADASVVSITFSGINTKKYRELIVLCELSTASSGAVKITINNISTGYIYRESHSSSPITDTDRLGELVSWGTNGGICCGKIELSYAPDAPGLQTVLARTISVAGHSSTPSYSSAADSIGGKLITLSSGITSIKLTSGAGNIKAGSKFAVYGVLK